jgi:hypothetical protein
LSISNQQIRFGAVIRCDRYANACGKRKTVTIDGMRLGKRRNDTISQLIGLIRPGHDGHYAELVTTHAADDVNFTDAVSKSRRDRGEHTVSNS